MIISASRRTDIPAFFSEWFYNRIQEGYVLVQNPMNPHQVRNVDLTPDSVDCIVFWTKNPEPMLERLMELKDFPFYFQFTLNSYGEDVEENVPDAINAFQRLSDKIGRERVIWRYDPILINPLYTESFHLESFERTASRLSDFTETCTISFLDHYRKIQKRMKQLEVQELSAGEKRRLAEQLVKIASAYGLKLETCAEDIELEDLGISHGKCIDDRLITRMTRCPLSVPKDKNQRLECGCVSSVDIGSYNTCRHGCKYCYANR
jgi:hypothetical protein